MEETDFIWRVTGVATLEFFFISTIKLKDTAKTCNCRTKEEMSAVGKAFFLIELIKYTESTAEAINAHA